MHDEAGVRKVFYRADDGSRTPYLPQKLVRKLKDIDYYGQPNEVLDSWASRETTLGLGAPAKISANQKLVVLLPGLGVTSSNYALLAQEIANRGYVVAVSELPYLGSDFGPDGAWQGADLDLLLANGEQESWGPRFEDWSTDVVRLISRLQEAPELERVGLSINSNSIVLVGHSLGGAIAFHACPSDPRIAVCMNFEGAPFGTRMLEEGPVKPTLFVLSRSVREGEARTAPSIEGPMFGFLAQGNGSPAWAVKVAGGSHMSFSDAPLVMPDTITQFGGEVLLPDRSMSLYADIVDLFAKAHEEGGDRQSFESFVTTTPELLGTNLGASQHRGAPRPRCAAAPTSLRYTSALRLPRRGWL